MKISNSKKQLAKIISENGGWLEGAEFTAQDGDGTGSIDFFKSKPRLDRGDRFWKGDYDCGDRIERTGVTIKNWHQTILSREEYFHLYPTPDADGWIAWNGGDSPVDDRTYVDVKLANGCEYKKQFMLMGSWSHDNGEFNILAYRLHKPEQAKPEFCESVMRSIPEPEAKPTIEQLAADYRNAKDYAERKQQEADDAKADADEKLRVLELAGEALGLLVSPITEKQGPGLVAAKFTGKFHSAKHGDRPISLDMVCDGCGKRFGHHVGFECRP